MCGRYCRRCEFTGSGTDQLGVNSKQVLHHELLATTGQISMTDCGGTESDGWDMQPVNLLVSWPSTCYLHRATLGSHLSWIDIAVRGLGSRLQD